MSTHSKVQDNNADFTTDRRVLLLSAMAALIGVASAILGWILVQLIALVTNLAFYQTFSFALTSPANNQLGIFVIFIPIIGGLLVG
ncbi:MAG: chloride channel protein, partial [Chloroflexi bacterium]